MTKLLEKAFKKSSNLPDSIQNLLAQQILDEIESELKWDNLFIESQDILESMAEEAVSNYKAGKTIFY